MNTITKAATMLEEAKEITLASINEKDSTPDSRCGLHCTGCTWKESCGCGGCMETQGHPFHGECPIAVCCQNKGLTHCGECDIMPCSKLFSYSFLDPDHGDKPQGTRIKDLRRWAALSGKQAWHNVLLTSAGFETMDGRQKKNIVNKFLGMLSKPAAETRVLFIPTAAITSEAKEMASKCKRELIHIGILPEHIVHYEIDQNLTADDAMLYDMIYFTGGDTGHLLKCIKETGFDKIIKKMVYAGKVYVGVSAGSLITTPNIGDPYCVATSGLALIHTYLSVHCKEGESPRTDMPLNHIPLTDNQAIAVSWDGYEIIQD